MWQTEDQWPRQDSYENEIQESSPEVRKVTTVIKEHGSMLSRFERFSNWQRLKTAVALCMEYKRRLRMSINTANRNLQVDEGPKINGRSRKAKRCPATRIMVQDLEQAEVEILKLVQTNAFDKVKALQAQSEGARKGRQCDKERRALLKKSISLNTLDPYLDAIGVLRVRGRITKANLADGLNNPVILPKTVHITELIIRHAHEKTHHSERGVTLNELRSNVY